MTSNYNAVCENFGIDGSVDAASLSSLRAKYNSILYLSTDSPTDQGVEGGYAAAETLFSGASAHVALDAGADSFNPAVVRANVIPAAQAYRAFAAALDSLPKPTLIVCKTARRASAVLAAYLAQKFNWTVERVTEYATEKGFTYLGHEGLSAWVNAVTSALATAKAPLLIRQLFEAESSTYTYLIADKSTGEALLIDPVLETVDRDANLIVELGLTLKYVINTHVHADHITGSGLLKQRFAGCQSAISLASTGDADIKLNEFDKLHIGSRHIFCLHTPGHTVGCFTYVLDDLSAVFTGDAVLIRGCGRTDFQGGSSATLYRSIHDKIFALPDSCIVYTGHDYKGNTASSIGEEKRWNPRLTKSLEEFEAIMAGLNLAYPKKIDIAVPRNFRCGF